MEKNQPLSRRDVHLHTKICTATTMLLLRLHSQPCSCSTNSFSQRRVPSSLPFPQGQGEMHPPIPFF